MTENNFSQKAMNDALFQAIKTNDTEGARASLDAGASANALIVSTWSALMDAAYRGRADIVELLCQRGARVNHRDSMGRTALQMSSTTTEDTRQIARTLLANGADPNIHDNDGSTPLILALKREKSLDFIELLLDRGSDTNKTNILKQTALSVALRNKNDPHAEALIAAGADIESIKHEFPKKYLELKPVAEACRLKNTARRRKVDAAPALGI